MQKELNSAAWALGVWGAFSVIFGGVVLAWPGITLKAFLIVLGAYFVASGLVLMVGSLVNRQGKWAAGALMGGLSLVAGLYVFANPGISALVTLYVIALWAIAAGMLQLVAGFEGKNNWWLIIAGAIYTLFGFYIFGNPAEGALVLMWLIGLSAIAGGISLVIVAFEAHRESNILKAAKKA